MKILLAGEYSGFFTNLKKGFLELGHDCTLISNKDNWKKIEGTDKVLFNTGGRNPITKTYNTMIEPIISQKKLYGYDVVHTVAPRIYSRHINQYMFDILMKHNGKVYTSISGGTYSLYKSYKDGTLGYYTFDDNPELCKNYEGNAGEFIRKQEEYIFNNVNGIIPIMYEYAVGVRDRKNCKKTIPLPFDSTAVEYSENKVNGKIVIMHGIIREASKGSKYIREALDIIAQKYPNDVEVIIDGKMPLNDYLNLLKRVNILVDQCKEHCYGMNALYAMAEGRIVLGGASVNSLKEFGLTTCPVIHIEPNVEMIVEQLERLILQKNEFEKLGYESRKFVEEFHDCKKIARQYLEVWNS